MTGIANVGKVSEYQFHICNTANFFISQKSKGVNLPISAVLVLNKLGKLVLWCTCRLLSNLTFI